MSGSVQRSDEENTPEKIKERLRNLPEKTEKKEPADLPRWAKVAMAQHDVLGLTWKEAAKRHNRAAGTLSGYKSSPAGKKWRALIQEFADDPVEISKAILRGSSASLTIDYMLVLQSAMEAGDYKEAGKMLRDLHDRVGIQKKQPKQEQSKIVINLGDLGEIPTIDAEYTVIGDEDE